MAMDPQFRDFMGSTVIIEPFTSLSTDGFGTRTYGSASTAVCRLEQDLKIVMNKEGREIASNLQAYIAPYDRSTGQTAISISATDRLTFPSGYQTSAILQVERHNDEFGAVMYFAVLL